MARPISVLELTTEEEAELHRRVHASTASTRDRQRARIVLLRAQGMKQTDVARELGTSTTSVNKWSQRFERAGLDGLVDRPGRGRKTALTPATVEQVLAKAGQRAPGTQRRSTRGTAAEVGVSPSSVTRIWRRHGLKPHLKRTFKLSTDPHFEAKFWDVIGLYLDPPEKAVILCCDEKTQIQALERTQPGLPLGMGHIATETHDYYRHGTITLFAAFELPGRQVDQPTRSQAYPCRMAALPQTNSSGNTHRPRHSHGRRQLCHPQTSQSQSLARQAPALPHALHPYVQFLAQHGRALLC